ncbi:uncharacterized protein LOC136070919 [Quercus suber]|uniref:Uncharacterized protein n=1 Tax=Quercus suber TaxID=58331 RepID=A0AAW0KM39_QUESU
MVNPQTNKLVRRTTMVATLTASYFLLTADYGSEPNALSLFEGLVGCEESVEKKRSKLYGRLY